ncbi:MAG: M48 family metalloprotease [Promethearchaeota archaeon]
MKFHTRFTLFSSYLIGSIIIFYFFIIIFLNVNFIELITDWSFIITAFLYCLTIEEGYHWLKNGKRSEMSDLVAIVFFFFVIFFFSKDLLTSLMGAFSIYLWIGIFELKDYPVLNKLLIISLVTYNIIFIAGIFSSYYDNPFYVNTSFAFSFWIILIMGFLLFGRKYIVVWRFMSPEYLTLFLYIIAWLAVVFINQYTPIKLLTSNPVDFNHFHLIDFFLNIYFILIIVNWLIYFISGIVLDKLLGIKTVKNNAIIAIVNEVKHNIGIKSKVKIGFGKYPILNAMAYGSFFDKRIAVIADDINSIPEDELRGIVAHELAHTKGNHTLILTLITSLDLVIRMLLGIPATFYDYTFGDPQIPLILFILLNLLIYVILFIFVRYLEGKADLKAKNSGYGNELVKALYNLESFYATGREIGFNTMLLCEEKISKDNQLLDYMNTASYLYRSMIKPSKASLLGSFINSHPPSYFRIAAILSEKVTPSKEAILPLICLKKSKQKKYAQKFVQARREFKKIANEKFKELFIVNDISLLMDNIMRKEFYKYDLNKDYIFINQITDEIILGKLQDIKFIDNICETDQLVITNLKTNQTQYLEPSMYTRTQIDLNGIYFLHKEDPLILRDINLKVSNDEKSFYIFLDKKKNQKLKPILKTKLPNSTKLIKDLKNFNVFLKLKGKLKIMTCSNITTADNYDEYMITLSESNSSKNPNKEYLNYFLKELIIKPNNIYLSISKNRSFRESELEVIRWLIQNNILTHIYLKKPVNNLEIGFIKRIILRTEDLNLKTQNKEEQEKNIINLVNIFGNKIEIPYNIIDLIAFEYNSVMIQIKSATSISSRLGYKILKKFKPERIIIM